ncbi:D-alanyl-D-alanine carboxypeptidase family protein [Fervidibacillus halotolerans]|uniref:D-alanyl-D-alanine carboxypeptidase n=1 Tax=Fervidibacillus halotolerans TaxID=2980027 RepID=A0A9E8LZD3_9BACI|nr:D-alanyl-D-alanine carboxypeptidase family protein [Fervidibacillus halotolerans]WAA12505.1 D-alanyl-D-alanine carboxypeptidase [Fervidibacillus halotolerans]
MTVTANENTVHIESETAVLMDAKSGQVLFGKNEQKTMYPASITKVATAIYALDNTEMDEIVEISEKATDVEGTKVYLIPGEKVPIKKLLIGMIMNSGNDAAYAIAEYIDGTMDDFEKNINMFLKEKAGVEHTLFVNPHGLFNEAHYTTAEDMARITRYALQNEGFRNLFQMTEYDWEGEGWETTLLTHHRLLKGEFPYEGITGGKNGFVNESGYTLVTTAKRDGLELIAVTMKTNLKNVPYTDTIQLLDYGFDHFETKKVEKGSIFETEEGHFIANEDLFFTINKQHTYVTQVSNDGTLTIIDENTNETLAKFSLTQEDMKVVKMQEAVASEIDEKKEHKIMQTILFGLIPFMFLPAVLLIGRWNKSRERFF